MRLLRPRVRGSRSSSSWSIVSTSGPLVPDRDPRVGAGSPPRCRTRPPRPRRSFDASLDDRGATKVMSLWAIGGLAAHSGPMPFRDLAELPASPHVRLDRVFADARVCAQGLADGDWNLEMVGAPDLWEDGIRGDGIVVAVVDSGVDAAHEDLGPRWRGGMQRVVRPYGEHSSPLRRRQPRHPGCRAHRRW